MKLGMALMAILLTVGLPDAVSFDSSASISDLWHVPGTPTIISQEVHFANASADLVGTVYLPNIGDHLPAVVVLHHAGAATREADLYRHLRDGLPALGFAVLIYDRRGSGQSSGSLEVLIMKRWRTTPSLGNTRWQSFPALIRPRSVFGD
jgi:pimeloyl-ACP methyl ester carboxylesterase